MMRPFASAVLGICAAFVILTCPTILAQEVTLEETGKYLVDKLRGLKGTSTYEHGSLQTATVTEITVYSTSDVTFTNCSLSFTKSTERITSRKGGATVSAKTEYHIPVKQVEPDSIQFKEHSGDRTISGNIVSARATTGYLRLIVNANLETNGKPVDGNKEVRIEIDQKDEYKADGLVKALRQAVELCGGKKDPFGK